MPPDSDRQKKDGSGPESKCCKVKRSAAAFDIPGVVDDLATLRQDGDSFRDITDYFNTQIVDRALSRAGIGGGRSIHAALTGDDIAGEVYRALQSDHYSDIRRAEVRARLSDAGIDVDRLEAALVSHVTVSSHLQDCVDVEPESSQPPFEQTVNTAQGAKTRAGNVIQSTIDRAIRNEQLQTGQLETEVVVQLTCQDCGDTYYLTELLERKECTCALANKTGN